MLKKKSPKASLPGIDIRTALFRVMGNKKLYLRLLLIFKEKYLSLSDDIRKALKDKNYKLATEIILAAKEAAELISAVKVSNAADWIHEEIENEEFDKIESSLRELEEMLQIVIFSINKIKKDKTLLS